MKKSLMLMVVMAEAALAQTNGEWTVNRLPGTGTLWTAQRTRAELAGLSNYVGAAVTAGTQGLASAASVAAVASRIDGSAIVWSSERGSRLATIDEGGTCTVWRVSVAGTNYTVTVSDDFLDLDLGWKPSWTTHAWPFSDVGWVGQEQDGALEIGAGELSLTKWRSETPIVYPALLSPIASARGTAVVSAHAVLSTNFFARLASTEDLASYTTMQDVYDWWSETGIYDAGVIAADTFQTFANTTDPMPQYLLKSSGDARYFQVQPGRFWQGSQQVTTNAYTTNYVGIAAYTNGQIALVPYTTTQHGLTGSVELVSQTYIVGVSYGIILPNTGQMPLQPVAYEEHRSSPTSVVISAWVDSNPAQGFTYYVGILTNLLVYGYDRAEMSPGAYTNDAAGIVARVDDASVTAGDRSAINANTLVNYVNSRKDEIAAHAYDFTPSGARTPNASVFTVDEPMVQQGQIAYMHSGDYYCQSYVGGDWYQVSTGSVWRIGPSGRVAFEIASTNRVLHIQGFTVAGGYATIDISTNWVVGTPSTEFTVDLLNPQWIACPYQTMSNRTNYWRSVCPAPAGARFFRVVDPSGDNVLRSYHRHEFLGGITIGTNTFHTLSELKAQLEALP